ncbi:PKD domain-containing protein [Methylomarinum sp. Ch1-1]|uniref:PKD domain-containing protein n=1 Tax=Methylomarinum roseum TaxID=3067653 RepID=A0AAU7NVG8_9GAMM|nr:PKD domain-containing protein [Methylomarinum sp. Ch1-1]MDP4523023.1 PKD domain-containing protein [Methylomarinum sp. Ch1-1]
MIPFNSPLIVAAVALALTPVGVLAKPDPIRHFGKKSPFTIDDLPASKAKTKLKALRGNRRQKAMNWLHSFAFTDRDLKHLHIDDDGGVLYGDVFDLSDLTETSSDGVEQPLAVSAADTFKLHSKPGASNIIYIDVNGHTLSGTAWNSGSASIQAQPYDSDGDTTGFSALELAEIAEIWHRVAEDYVPFDVDVTTEEPGSFGPTTGRLLITHNEDAAGNPMPYASAGGVAYVNVWGRSNYASYYSPALVYYNNLATFPPYIAEAASHEMGHNLSLSHDGTSTQSYYGGHGTGFVSWGPIMGVGYYGNVTQWSKGEYNDASQTEDDIALIGQRLTVRTDDHGDDLFNPTALLIDEQGNISVTSPEADPHNLAPYNKGIIETRSDVDFFAFDAGSGALEITVTPAWDSFYRSSRRGANLDIQATLYDWDGQVIASSDPLDETDARINASVENGQYLLAVSGVGNDVTPYSDYGSVGQYFISGAVTPFSTNNDTTPPNPDPMSWSVAPYSVSRTSIAMQASPASDDSGAVEYLFSCVSGGCGDSGWQTSNQYTAMDLQAGTAYGFQVTARDAYGNETQPSIVASAATASNANPQSNDANITTAEDQSLSIELSALASDDDGDPLSFTIQSPPANGSVVNHNNGSVMYTPNADFYGADSFVYSVHDGFGGSSAASVTIEVSPVNDAPVAAVSAPADNATLTVAFSSAGSFDPDTNDALSYQWNFGDGSGSSAANPSHSYSAAGTYNVTLTVTDPGGLSDSASVTTTVNNPDNMLPGTPGALSYSVDKVVSGWGWRKTISGTVLLGWGRAELASEYEVWRCEEITSGRGKNKTTRCDYSSWLAVTGETRYTTPLIDGAVHYKVRARNANGVSDFTNEVVVSP